MKYGLFNIVDITRLFFKQKERKVNVLMSIYQS